MSKIKLALAILFICPSLALAGSPCSTGSCYTPTVTTVTTYERPVVLQLVTPYSYYTPSQALQEVAQFERFRGYATALEEYERINGKAPNSSSNARKASVPPPKPSPLDRLSNAILSSIPTDSESYQPNSIQDEGLSVLASGCTQCHSIGGAGTKLGPTLFDSNGTEIATDYDKAEAWGAIKSNRMPPNKPLTNDQAIKVRLHYYPSTGDK